jgi:hypothetical protein
MIKKIFILFCFITPLFVQAQDFGIRAEVELEKKLNDSFTGHLSAQTRFSSSAGTVMSYISEAGVEYFIVKKLSISGFYRYIGTNYIDKDTPDVYQSFHRFAANLTYEDDLLPWLGFENRLRYQNQFKDEDYGLITTGRYFRNKMTFSYNNKTAFSPYLAGDVFYETASGFDEIRCQAGMVYKFKNKNELDISVMQDRSFKTGKGEHLVFAFIYKFKF